MDQRAAAAIAFCVVGCLTVPATGQTVDPRSGPVAAETLEKPLAETASEVAARAVRETLTVTASRDVRPAFEEPATVEVITENDIVLRRKAANFVDALREVPAVSVQKTAQGQGSPYIRGFTGFLNLLLIDGVRFNNSVFRSGPNQYWATIDPLTSSQIEIVKGPGSVLYGPDAVGGTVNVLTRDADPGLEGPRKPTEGLFLRAASAERSGIARVEIHGSTARFGYLAGASLKSFGDLETGGQIGTVERSGYDAGGGDARLHWKVAGDDDLILLVQAYRMDDVPRTETTIFSPPWNGTRPGSEQRRDHDQKRSLTYLKYRSRPATRALSEAEVTLSYQTTEEERLRVLGDGRSDVSGFDVDTVGAQAQLRSVGPWGRLTWGAELYRDAVDSFRTDYADGFGRKTRIQGPIADDASYLLLGVYANDELRLAGESLTLQIGARYNYTALDARRVEAPDTGEEISLDDAWSKVVGSLRMLWRPDLREGDRWHLFGSLAQSFRAPNLSDLTSFDSTSAIETPATDLEPENYLTAEIGAKAVVRRLSGSASVFYTVIENQIVQSPTGSFLDGTPAVRKSNVGDGFMTGFELAGDWQATATWGLWANLSHLEGEVDQILFRDGGATLVRAPASRVVPWMGNGGVRYRPPTAPWWIELHGTAFSKADKLALRDVTDTRRIPPGGTPGFAVIGLRGAVDLLADRLALAAGLENLLDKDYRIHGSGQNMPGRNLVVSLRWRR